MTAGNVSPFPRTPEAASVSSGEHQSVLNQGVLYTPPATEIGADGKSICRCQAYFPTLVKERLAALKQQEMSTYACRDYLQIQSNIKHCPKFDSDFGTFPQSRKSRKFDYASSDDSFTADCRKKMCSWSYHIIDHFHMPREVVSTAFAILDLFLSNGKNCDVTTFKLASMTCLYISSKTSNRSFHLYPHSLAALSRDEFTECHFLAMELAVLEAVGWRVNPPTASAFVDEFIQLLPTNDGTREAICLRAHFYSELSVLDYCFVPEQKSDVAVSCLLNAMDESVPCIGLRASRQLRGEFLREVQEYTWRNELSYDMMQEQLRRLAYVEIGNARHYRTELAMSDGNGGKLIQHSPSAPVSPLSVSQESV
eukprot:CAMPEP_0113528290 /NCGR_PEP_ID=MMETSP0015_2-20120614/1763_1 /TAXON_ID=2838 /ORGANISM="Odontella" /LENGTH=366 /DNA_ID=CAMNT_0000426807 /DNA_START=658 /DNA_END=1758 /DNA_ORIENTATION=- /assembly_acc=CAM_ASM_000160